MRPDTLAAIQARISSTSEERARSRAAALSGDSKAAEEDFTRITAFDARVSRAAGIPESVLETNDFQPASFLTEGANCRRAVARILVQTPTESRSGSGFLISPDLFITNQHVLNSEDDAQNAIVIFDDELDQAGKPLRQTRFRLDPKKLSLFSDEALLDFAVIAIGDRIDGAAALSELGFCPLSFSPDRHRKGMNVNIIQHPNSMPKTIAIRNNLLTAREETKLLYETDTEVGSSGSPVFNDQWDVVALHHYGAAEGQASGVASGTKVNEGIRISSIYTDLQEQAKSLGMVGKELMNRALRLWKDTAPVGKRLEARPPPNQQSSENLTRHLTPTREASMSTLTGNQSTTVPVEIIIRIGAPTGTTISTTTVDSTADMSKAAKRLVMNSEAVKLDTNYTNRNGYDSEFVDGLKVDLSRITKPRKSSIATLVDGESDAEGGELRYQNFSVILHKKRKFALLTATNIDGPAYVEIDRKTGLPKVPEGETWYKDPRVDATHYVGQDFYSGWSHLFDRGHLTRRNDPTWGEFATRANKDTFHFSNCTPQHWKFNQSVTFWQGIERYVLEQGLQVTGEKAKLTVLQGPVFDSDDLWADDVQIPSAFWKIVIWKGKKGLKAVGMIADQTKLFSLERRPGGAPPPPETPVEVGQYRVSIASLTSKTGLDFSAIESIDTSKQDLPTVGEHLRLVTKWNDIPLE